MHNVSDNYDDYDAGGSDLHSCHQSADKLLDQGAAALGVALDNAQRARLLAYLKLLAKWTQVYNLTATCDLHQLLIQHLLDSLAVVPYLASLGNATVLDVGTGGGLPGIVLAIALPACYVTLNDITCKKIAFLTQAKALLPLPNTTVRMGRVELLRPGMDGKGQFNVLISRAFAKLVDFVSVTRHLVAPGGSIWAMKGIRPTAEMIALQNRDNARIAQVIKLNVPFLKAERHLIQITV